ncbi:hypothetical protein C1H76_4717 [Elsinoe australis]|uniref:Uncharacterized protein n=1 Tax=Elsinoe australis TaxID=40998 RepID=A0A4U7B0D2_9PEZI|nr:hypothetical protein C1H76_4717 [Elsinoe australis]
MRVPSTLILFLTVPSAWAAGFGKYPTTNQTTTGALNYTNFNQLSDSVYLGSIIFGFDQPAFTRMTTAPGQNTSVAWSSFKEAAIDTAVEAITGVAPERGDYAVVAYQTPRKNQRQWYGEDRGQGSSNPSSPESKPYLNQCAGWREPFLPRKRTLLLSGFNPNVTLKVTCKNGCGMWGTNVFGENESDRTTSLPKVRGLMGMLLDSMKGYAATATQFTTWDSDAVVARCRFTMFEDSTLLDSCPDVIDGVGC